MAETSTDMTLESLGAQLAVEAAQNDFLMERLAELELALEDEGWSRLAADTAWEFSRDGIDRIIALSRLNTLKNPLIKRGVTIKANYVFGQGVEIEARDADVNTIVQQFLDDRSNAAELFSAKARTLKDRTLTTDGNVVFVLFPNKLTGHVSIRSISVDEVRDKIVNPNDRQETWFYLRRWTERDWSFLDGGFGDRLRTREAWYPDWRYEPPAGQRVESIMRIPVRWDTPIYHVTVGELDGMRFGIPETYAALDWAKAYKLFLEDWATIVRSLSRFAWQQTVKKNPSRAAQRLGSTVATGTGETNPSPAAGSVYSSVEGNQLKPIPKTDATVDAESGRPLAMMVAAALGVPVTWLLADPGLTGARATAETLDRPTELEFTSRQDLWVDVYRDLAGYQVDWAIRALVGPLDGRAELGPDGKQRWVLDDVTIDDPIAGTKTMTGAERRTIDVTFPPLTEHDVVQMVQAIVAADGTEKINPKVILRLLLTVLGVENVDEHVANFDDEQAERDRKRAELGDEMVNRFRAGRDPLGNDD